ncbi:MAG: VOC family protein [bacterium]
MAVPRVDGFDVPVERHGPGLTFVPVPEDKTAKNRLHLDLAPAPMTTRPRRWCGWSPWVRGAP